MNRVALKMLVGDRAKYVGIIVGITFASLLITQQMSIFVGLMTRTYGAIAIVTGSAKFEVTVKGENRTLDLLYHAVWAKRVAGTQFVSWQATKKG